jgi:hypothetical protein
MGKALDRIEGELTVLISHSPGTDKQMIKAHNAVLKACAEIQRLWGAK